MSTRSKGRVGILAGVCLLATSLVGTSGSAGAEPASTAGTRPVYVTNADVTNDVSTFATDLGTGRPVLTGDLVKAGDGVRQMAFTPDARTAYAANSGDGTISVYTVGPRGRLTPAGTVDSGGEDPLGVTVARNGRTLYVAHVDSNTVAVFAIAADGSLAPRETVPTGVHNPRGLAMTPDGRFLYVGHGDPGPDRATSVGAITAFAVNSDGTLTVVGSPVRVGRFCGDLAITPDGRRLYLISQDTDQIFGFAIGAKGDLTSLPLSPYEVSSFPEGVTISPDGRFVYTASLGAGGFGVGPGAVSGFAIGGDGSLTQVPGSPFRAGVFGIFPVEVTTVPNGRFVYASGGDATGQLMAFRVGPGGTLLPFADSPFDTRGVSPAYGSVSVLPNQGPGAGFATRVEGHAAALDASASTDADGSVARYRWDFGDGTTLSTADPRTTHVYPRAGTFRATLVVTDDEGCSTTLVATGRAVLCNGTAAATTTHDIVVRG
jgi:6-phosphogluconolactonase (cycloisomerase 2 family)